MCETIFKVLNSDQLYSLGCTLSSFGLLDQSIKLRDYVDKNYGIVSTDYMQHLIDCEKTGRDYPQTIKTIIHNSTIDREALEMLAVMPIRMYEHIKDAIRLDETFTIEQRTEISEVADMYLKLKTKEVQAS